MTWFGSMVTSTRVFPGGDVEALQRSESIPVTKNRTTGEHKGRRSCHLPADPRANRTQSADNDQQNSTGDRRPHSPAPGRIGGDRVAVEVRSILVRDLPDLVGWQVPYHLLGSLLGIGPTRVHMWVVDLEHDRSEEH